MTLVFDMCAVGISECRLTLTNIKVPVDGQRLDSGTVDVINTLGAQKVAVRLPLLGLIRRD